MDQVYQLTQQTCTMCGQGGVSPRTEQHIDKYAQELVVEAIWQCHRCGSRFSSGTVSRTPINEKA